MVAWWWILVSLSIGAFVGLILSALLTAGATEDRERELDHWRKQAQRMATRYRVNLPLGPDKGEL